MPVARCGLRSFIAVCWCIHGMTAPAAAQEKVARAGFWFSGAVGYGGLSLRCQTCPGSGSEGVTLGMFRAGWMVGPNLLIGLEAGGWTQVGADESARILGATGSWYPSAEHGFFIRAGVGRQYFTGDRAGDGPIERGNGIALGAGMGVDLLVGENLSLTPTLLLIHGRPGTTELVGLPQRREL
ncbi:MAG: hypothetical protein H0T68_11290 [Gemmatimonadales bacterium]|nr:hypothetical protein [Gemmatimonadales bacterium]MBA3555461.1 hypothetical protein [Gemmatimonadales bacterium]